MFTISTYLLQHYEGWILLAYLSMVLLRVQDNCWFISSTLLASASGLSYENLFVSLSVSLTLVGCGSGWNLYVHLWFLFWAVILLWLYFYCKVTCFTPIIGDRKAISENLVSSPLPEVWYVFSDCVSFRSVAWGNLSMDMTWLSLVDSFPSFLNWVLFLDILSETFEEYTNSLCCRRTRLKGTV